MCGFFGSMNFGDRISSEKSLRLLAHRGPDGQKILFHEPSRTWLGHTRLAIIDPSPEAAQPMWSNDKRLVIVYNGEIYNHNELRADLRILGKKFRTHSDTEVLLEAYREWGESCVCRFHGMFAFVILDCRESCEHPKVFMARDRIGIKPLYYWSHSNKLCFASETRALLPLFPSKPNIDTDALYDFFSFGSVADPLTIYSGIKALPAAHTATFHDGRTNLRRYWDLHAVTSARRKEYNALSYKDAVDLVEEKLRLAARYHQVSDVPISSFLSGGIDSAVTTGLSAQISVNPISTYSVGFSESEWQPFNELDRAQFAARYLNTIHHELKLTRSDIPGIAMSFFTALDQPSVDGLNTWIVSRFASASHKVALSGLGGDEFFGGYDMFRHYAINRVKHPRSHPLLDIVLRTISHAAQFSGPVTRLRLQTASPIYRLSLFRRTNHDSTCHRFLNPDLCAKRESLIAKRFMNFWREDADPYQQLSLSELNGYLSNTLLRDSDVMSMAHGLELRPVLLDHELIETVYSLPGKLKHEFPNQKQLLIDAGREFLAPENINQKKRGFVMPQRLWIAGPLRQLALDTLNTNILNDFFKPSAIFKLRKKLQKGVVSSQTWHCLVIAQWLMKNSG